ncbi:hypothetical protein J6590_059587 [Homalodisca vitripennis]|nr:hypothetical protein J6590_059587 [Homalodisca vitripennis]
MAVHNNENVVVQLSKSSTFTQTMEPVVVLNKTNATSMESGFSGSQLHSRLRNQSQVLPSPNMNINLFDDSQIASIRDQLAVEQATQQRSRRKPKASTAARPTKVDASIVAQPKVVVNPKDVSQLPGVKAVTRTGRPIKSPASFWAVDKDVTIRQQPKQNGTSRTTKVDLNDTLTLRSKVIERKTPPNRNRIDSANSTPLSPITENKLSLKNSNKSQIKKSQVQENKENSEVQKKRTTKSTNKNKTNVSEDSSKEKSKMKVGRPKKKTQPVNKHDVSLITSWSSGSPWNGWIHDHSSSLPKTPEKKKPVKRKSKEAEAMDSKKKKVEDVPARRAEYIRFSEEENPVFPAKFCAVRWLENAEVAEKALKALPYLEKFVEGVEEEGIKISSKSYSNLAKGLKEKILPVRLAFFILSKVTSLTKQTDVDLKNSANFLAEKHVKVWNAMFRRARTEYGEVLEEQKRQNAEKASEASIKRTILQQIADLKAKRAKVLSEKTSEITSVDDEITSLMSKLG